MPFVTEKCVLANVLESGRFYYYWHDYFAYILGRRLIIVEDLVAVRITRMFVMSSHGGKTKVDLPPSYFRTWLTLGNRGDWL